MSLDHGPPRVNHRVLVRLPEWSESLPTRVEGWTDGDLLLGAPFRVTTELAPATPGATFLMGWADGAGRHYAAALLLAVDVGPLPLWRARRQGPVHSVQRREFVRLTATLPGTLVHKNAESVPIAILDISESGLSFGAPTQAPPDIGTLLGIRVPIGDEVVCLSARAVRTAQSTRGEWVVGVRFEGTAPAVADTLRRFVFREHLADRARRLR